MNLKKRLQRKITIKNYELSLIMISVISFILFLITVWPRFRSDAMSVAWYWYLAGGIVFFVLGWRKVNFDKN